MNKILAFVLFASLASGQQNPITVTASAPSPVSASINYGGPQGQSEICYWVVAKYPIGNVPPPTGACIFTGAPVTSGNSAIVNWNAMQGAVGYDVLRTLTETLTSSCTNCLLISNTTQTTFTDIGGSLPSYNLSNVPSPVKQFMQLDNQNYATPEFIIFPYPIRVGQSLIFPDGSVQTTASGSGTITTVNGTSPIVSSQVGATATISCSTCLTGTPTANAIQVGNGTQTLQSRLATEDTSGNISTPGSMTTGVGGGPGEITWGPLLFAGLPATAPGTANGSIVYCSDCTINSNPCTGAGTGAFAERVNNAWVCGVPAGSGTVTSVGLVGTANQLTVTGSSPITTSGSWTISIPAGLFLGTDNATAGTLQLANGTANAHTIWASGATTTNTIAGFTAVPTTGHLITCTVSSTTCTLTDGGAVPTGTITNFTAGTLSPLFTTSVATSTTTPALTFSLTNAAGGTLFGNNTSSSGAPAYVTAPVLGVDNTTAGTLQLANSTAAAHTIFASGATTTNTIAGFTAVPATGDLVSCTSASTTCTLTDAGVVALNVVVAASAPGTANQIAVSTSTSKALSFIDYPDSKSVPFAICVNGTASTGVTTTTSVGATCRAGTNNKDAYIGPFTTSDSVTFKVHLPKDWDPTTAPSLSVDLATTDATSGHTIILQAATSCSKLDGSTTDDIAFNAAQSMGTITLFATANQTWTTTISSLTTTGCIPPSIMWVKITRTTDTATNVELYEADITIPRLLKVQAN